MQFSDFLNISSLGIGLLSIAVSLTIFGVQFKAQQDARKERVRFANSELITQMMRSFVIEKKSLSPNQFEALKSAICYSTSIQRASLIDFNLALDCAYRDILANAFIERESRIAAISAIDSSRLEKDVVRLPSEPRLKWRDFTLPGIFGIGSGALAALASFIVKGRDATPKLGVKGDIYLNPQVIGASLLVLIAALVVAWLARSRMTSFDIDHYYPEFFEASNKVLKKTLKRQADGLDNFKL